MIQKEEWPGYISIRHDDGRYIGRVEWKKDHAECYCNCEFWRVDEPISRATNLEKRKKRLMDEAVMQVKQKGES